jgi:hypothetical protein
VAACSAMDRGTAFPSRSLVALPSAASTRASAMPPTGTATPAGVSSALLGPPLPLVWAVCPPVVGRSAIGSAIGGPTELVKLGEEARRVAIPVRADGAAPRRGGLVDKVRGRSRGERSRPNAEAASSRSAAATRPPPRFEPRATSAAPGASAVGMRQPRSDGSTRPRTGLVRVPTAPGSSVALSGLPVLSARGGDAFSCFCFVCCGCGSSCACRLGAHSFGTVGSSAGALMPRAVARVSSPPNMRHV